MIRPRSLLAVGLLAALILVAVLLPVPDPAQLRAWALAAGPAAPALLFAAYAVATVAPLPRTVFTLAAGLLLGTVAGVTVAVGATAVSAALGFGLARAVGRDLVARRLDHRAVRTVDTQLAEGNWLTVASLRLIPVVPFAPLNYCCGVSSVRFLPYLAGTVAGSLPGTTAVVVFGDSLTGSTSPALLAVSACCAAVGATGLYLAIRRRSRTGDRPDPAAAPPEPEALTRP
ncbi:TVP38/TMEM64 family protein [Gandjariella thermophila]|uniref:TVP38/TMEM64 family membrane protein n=1 Tax=Gandjariella thermophila TaxID=1931992 RepID=A0A4D4J4A6_9PSEU|nr:TVP38/TMEM64 family protein [Gandjariella thermophila]GDY29578.1 TVP38/TMEM64 family protein [Gandjariella thermophila]